MARLVSVNVGRPREVAWRGQTVRTAIWKERVEGRRWVGRLNVDGDGQADLIAHGGEHRAVYVYQIESYRYWRDQRGQSGTHWAHRSASGLGGFPRPAGDRAQPGKQQRGLLRAGAGRWAPPYRRPSRAVSDAAAPAGAGRAAPVAQLLPLRSTRRRAVPHQRQAGTTWSGSTYLHTAVHIGDLLDVGAPRGTFTLQSGDGPVVLTSAGVGATPVLAMLKALAAESSTREVWWLYGCQNRAEHPFAEESRALVSLLPHGRSHIRYSRPGPGDRPGLDFDAPGHLEIALLNELGVLRDADFYLCGPASFLRDFTAGLVDWGVSADRVHREVFGPQVSKLPTRPPHPPSGPLGTGPVVSFSRSGLTVRWGTPFRSLLELAEACDVPADWSCRTGVCHRCESALVDGDVAYDPDPLDAPAPGNVLLCCARPQTDVVLDL